MRINRLQFAALAASVLLLPVVGHAHHGWTEFDEKTEITIEGTVADFHFVNPHCVVEIERKHNSGRVEKWQGEFSNPGALSRKGWNAATLQPGDKITMTGHPAKGNIPAMHVSKIGMQNGKNVNVESSE